MGLTTLQKLALALATECPACHAQPGEPCQTPPPLLLDVHGMRRDAAIPDDATLFQLVNR